MNMTINEDALNWYKEELDLESGDQVRFFVRYGGCSNVQKGFSLGVAKDAPQEAGVTAEADGITFFIEESDLWYFDNHDLLVSYSEDADEPVFEMNFKKTVVSALSISALALSVSGVASAHEINSTPTEVKNISISPTHVIKIQDYNLPLKVGETYSVKNNSI